MKNNVLTTSEMKVLDINAEYYGISRLQLMENAGRNIAKQVESRFKTQKEIGIFCGLGGNGGDGLVAARHLHCLGFKVTVILGGKKSQKMDEATRKNLDALLSLRGSINLVEVYDSSLIPNLNFHISIDALLGIGLIQPPRPPISKIIKKINRTDSFRIAVDIPSGINSDSGEVLGEAVKADLTVTFHKNKPGLKIANKYVGELVVTDIGIPNEIEKYTGPGDVIIVNKPRPIKSHKGDFGRLLIIGGSKTYTGAPTLVALAALRTGVDLAYIAAPHATAYAISSISPDLITLKLKGDHLNLHNLPDIKRNLEKATAVVIGPGLGLNRETEETISEILKIVESFKIPILLDADSLKAFVNFKHKIKTPAVLTPHLGEYKILINMDIPDNIQERVESVRQTAQDLDTVILLKSNIDLVSNGCKTKLNFTGNPAMTVGGTGDVLSGIIGAFLAKGINPFEAAVAGSYINGIAGDYVKAEKGYHMVASDLIGWIPKVIADPTGLCLNLKTK
jgi:NAD(P)H-hydrate epimerase